MSSLWLAWGLHIPGAPLLLSDTSCATRTTGDLAGEFAGRGWPLFKRMAWIWAAYLALFVSSVFAFDQEHLWTARILSILLGVASPFLFPVFGESDCGWWLNGLRVGGVHAVCDLRLWTVDVVLREGHGMVGCSRLRDRAWRSGLVSC